MIKKIAVGELRVGMYVREFCGSWIDHPFWRAKCLLRTPEDLRRILASGVEEVLIDTAQGVDVSEVVLTVPATMPVKVARNDVLPSAPAPSANASRAEALHKAGELYRRSVPKIAALFGEARLGKAIDVETCESLIAEISDSVLRHPGALVSVARIKRQDQYTYMHSFAVCALMLSLGSKLGLRDEQLRTAAMAGLLHDLGKALIPLEVLAKPGRLTAAEFDVIKRHPSLGHELLVQGGGVDDVVLDVCLHHHEKMDGSGYPFRLDGSQISLYAKMGAICDVYDAVTSIRPYKAGWNPGDALRRMSQWRGHFDPKVFQAFVNAIGIYPVGALLRLQSGRLAVVTEQNPDSLLKPRVKAFFSTKSNWHIEPLEVDLSSHACRDGIVGYESAEDWPFKDLDHLWGAPHLAR